MSFADDVMEPEAVCVDFDLTPTALQRLARAVARLEAIDLLALAMVAERLIEDTDSDKTNDHGTNQHSEPDPPAEPEPEPAGVGGKGGGDVITSSAVRGSTSATYLTARIARDGSLE